jgi:dehydrogenase
MPTAVAVLGGGNGGHALAADLTRKGFSVHFASDECFSRHMRGTLDTKKINLQGIYGDYSYDIAMVTTDMAQAIEGIKYIFIAVPAYGIKNYAEKLSPLLRPGQVICLMPGTLGSLLFWKELKKNGIQDVIVAETNTLPYATRLVAPATSLIMSAFDPLKVGVLPASNSTNVVEELRQFFPQMTVVESVLACGLNSLNPIIHVPGCILNAGRIEYIQGNFHFYTEGFTNCVAHLTEAIDLERIELLKKLGYEADIVAHGIGGSIQTDSIEEAIANDPNFAQIKGPANFKNRYYTEDIPYGLAVWAKLGRLLNVDTPLMDACVNLGSILIGDNCWEKGYSMSDLGISSLDIPTLKAFLVEGY